VKTSSLSLPTPVLFGILLVTNTCLSYGTFSLMTKGFLFALGVLLPCVLWLLDRPASEKKTPTPTWSFPKSFFSPTTLLLFLLAAVLLRTWGLTTFRTWPTGDEGVLGFLAIERLLGRDDRFFTTVGQHPPFYLWSLTGSFALWKDSFTALWSLPALLSCLCVPLAYYAARTLFPPAFALLCALLMGFSYWPLLFGRFSHQATPIPLWELGALLLLALSLKRPPSQRPWLLSALGVWTGLGSLIFPAWGSVLILILVTVAWSTLRGPRRSPRLFFLFLGALGLGLLPLILGMLHSTEGFGRHILDVSHARSLSSLSVPLSFLTSLFWGTHGVKVDYGPVWGGVLNPVLASCFLLGILGIFREFRSPLSLWVLSALGLGLLPGLLSADYLEYFRIIQLLPLLLFVSAWGLFRLVPTLPSKGRGLLALLILSTALDLLHLGHPREGFQPFLPGAKTLPVQEHLAFQALEKESLSKGAGLVFTDFLPLVHGQSLPMAVHPFDATGNPRLDPDKATWAGLVTNRLYRPFLLRRFPEARWVDLGEGFPEFHTLTVGILPVTPGNRATLGEWREAQALFRALRLGSDGMFNDKARYQRTLDTHLPQGDALVKGDPFLVSALGEWAAQYYFGPSRKRNIEVLQRALEKGYPAPHLHYQLGAQLALEGEEAKARKSFLAATRGSRTP